MTLDFSGTLVDDFYVTWKASLEVLKALGSTAKPTRSEFRSSYVLPYWNCYKRFGLSTQVIKTKATPIFTVACERFRYKTTLIPEAKIVLETLKDWGIRTAVVSQAPTRLIRYCFEKFEIGRFIDVVVGLEDCKEQKPSPKPIQLALLKLGVSPENAIYVGDLPGDIIAGKRACVKTVAYYGSGAYGMKHKLAKTKPDYLIPKLSEVLTLLKLENQK